MSNSANLGELILQYKEQKTLIGMHCADQELDRFFAGYVEEIDGKKFHLRYVNTGGRPGKEGEERAWFHEREVDWIEHGTPYMRGLAMLEQAHEQFKDLQESRWSYSHRKIREGLKHCEATRQVCRLKFGEENDVRAFVDEVGREFVSLTLLEEDGSYFGKTVVRTRCITAIRVGGLEPACLTYLANALKFLS